jgi:hypothetical protein
MSTSSAPHLYIKQGTEWLRFNTMQELKDWEVAQAAAKENKCLQ